MNCKPGDLAVIVRSAHGHEGKIVRCLERYDGPWRGGFNGPGWRINLELSKYGQLHNFMLDSRLRPITPPAGTITTEEVKTLYAPSKETV